MFKYLNGLLASRPKKLQIAEDLDSSFLSAQPASDALGNCIPTGVSLSSGPAGRLFGTSRDRKVSKRHMKRVWLVGSALSRTFDGTKSCPTGTAVQMVRPSPRDGRLN